MLPGFSSTPSETDDNRKTAIINDELQRLNVDIATLQETRLADLGIVRESEYTFFWQGKASGEARIHGVGFAVRNKLMSKVELGNDGTERILTIKVNTTLGPVTLVSTYAPTLAASPEDKDAFYNQLSSLIRDIPPEQQLLLLGDFNARVGNDSEHWPTCIGKFGVGKMNENGQRLLELCSYHQLSIANTFFKSKPQHKVSWMHPRSKHWHQLDLIVSRRKHLNNIHYTRAFHSADCDTDHALVCCKIKLTPKRVHHGKTPRIPRIDTCSISVAEKQQQFAESFLEDFSSRPQRDSATAAWNELRHSIQETASSTFGLKKRTQEDWFVAKCHKIQPFLDVKRNALLAYKANPTRDNLFKLRKARNDSQRIARQCINEYWLELSQDIQRAADSGNIRKMYEGIKKAIGPTPTKTAPLKSLSGDLITDKEKQLQRWVEHYAELYSRLNTVRPSVFEALEQLPTLNELDNTPTLEELSHAIDQLTPGKAPGNDSIPPDLLKKCKSSLLVPIHNIMVKCWSEGAVPQDMRDAKIVTLFKNKGERSDCNNYRGISLLSIVGKVIARVMLVRLQVLAELVYPESQCGFRKNRSTIDMVFSLRQLQEKCREQHQPLFIAFIDLTKAFDLVSREGLFQLLPVIGCPPKLLSLIRSFHDNMMSTVQFDGNISDPFKIQSGVKQGCVLAPTLFGIFFALLLKYAFGQHTEGIYLHSRSDGKLFNPSRLKAKTKVRQVPIRDMLFADDAAIATHTEDELQYLMDQFSKACDDFGLTISVKKTQILHQGTETNPNITLNNDTLVNVDKFTYLGSTVTCNLSLDVEINQRIAKAATTLGRLSERVWDNNSLTRSTKMGVYRACVLSTLLYGSETWTTYARQERRLNTFHQRSLRRILGISWRDKVTNTDILSMARLPSLLNILRQRRLRWIGHVRRMPDGRIPKDLFYGELSKGKRSVGRPYLRYKDVLKRDLNAVNIDPSLWEHLAEDRDNWRTLTKRQLEQSEEAAQEKAIEKRRIRKAATRVPPVLPVPTAGDGTLNNQCSLCGRVCLSRIGLHSHFRRCSRSSN